MRLTVFLGAGVSIPSKLPTALELTDALFRPGLDEGPVVIRTRALLKILLEYDAADRKRGGLFETGQGIASSGSIYRASAPTYEDLFFLCEQIDLWASGLADHSLITAFLDVIEEQAGELLTGATREERMVDLGKFGRQGREHIHSTVAAILKRKYLGGLNLIDELARDQQVEQLNIVTLNHDTLVEQLFDKAGIEYVDGFGEPDGDVRWSDDKVYDRIDARVRLFKLHGSINWYSFLHSGIARTAVLLGDDANSALDGSGELLRPAISGPSFLTGMNKAISYNRSAYSDIHLRFQNLVRQTDRIIMSGYGWGDTAINFQLETWLDRCPAHKLVLLHRHPEELRQRSVTFSAGARAWVRQGRMTLVENWISEVVLQDIRSELA